MEKKTKEEILRIAEVVIPMPNSKGISGIIKAQRERWVEGFQYCQNQQAGGYPDSGHPKWIKVTPETMPDHEIEVLGITSNGNVFHVECDRLNGDIFYSPYNMQPKNIVYWQPLLAKP